MTAARRLLLAVAILAPSAAAAQTLTHRGSVEGLFIAHPRATPRDDTRLIADALFRYEPSLRAGAWRFDAALDARMDSSGLTQRSREVTWWDRTLQRPALSVARLSASWARGPLTVEVGKQFLRWGKTDILVPTDRFAPRDYVAVIKPALLGVTAARVTLSSTTDSLDVVFTPRFTPSRAPLLDSRWVVTPPAAAGVELRDMGASHPGRAQGGVRWNHIGRFLEASVSVFRGFTHVPYFEGTVRTFPLRVDVQRHYAPLTSVGGDLAAPVPWFTVKAEAAWLRSEPHQGGEQVQYVLQLEKASGEWLFIGGYAGEYVIHDGAPFRFAPDRGLTRAFIGRASRALQGNRELVVEGVVRQNGEGVYGRAEYSHGIGPHVRLVGDVNVFGGSEDDFLGQYRRNSAARMTMRVVF